MSPRRVLDTLFDLRFLLWQTEAGRTRRRVAGLNEDATSGDDVGRRERTTQLPRPKINRGWR